jgi:hypothetical protein
MPDEHTADGPILRHVDEAPAPGSGGDMALIEAVSAHVEHHLGPGAEVFHQIVSPWVHVDVLVVPPSAGRPCITLVTCGMAERAMQAPENDPALTHTELVMMLPPDWPIKEPRGSWPLTLLQDLAEIPHRFDTWLHIGHTVPNGDPAKPYARKCPFSGVVLAPTLLTPDEFDVLAVGEREIHFLGVVAMYSDEMDLKLTLGVEELFDRFDAAGVSEGLDETRASVADSKPRRFGFRRR